MNAAGNLKLKDEHISNLGISKEYSIESYIKQGIIEYVDVNEENNCLIALKESDITSGSNNNYNYGI